MLHGKERVLLKESQNPKSRMGDGGTSALRELEDGFTRNRSDILGEKRSTWQIYNP